MFLKGEQKDAAHLGTMCHDVRDLLWTGSSLMSAGAAIGDRLVSEKEGQEVALLMTGYLKHLYGPKPIVNRRQDNELKLYGDLGVEGVRLTGRCDGVIRRPKDPPLLYELKTTSHSMKQMEAMLRNGIQIHLYMHMLEQNGISCSGCVAEVIKKPFPGVVRRRKPKGKPEPYNAYLARCAEAVDKDPTRFYRRFYIKRTKEKETEAVETARQTAKMILSCKEEGAFPKIKGPHCFGKYGPCPYMQLCWYGKDGLYEHRPFQFDGEQEKEQNGS